MTPRARFLAALRGREVDRVPLDLDGFHLALPDEVDRIEDPGRREIARRVFGDSNSWIQCPAHDNRYLMTSPHFMRSRKTAGANGDVTTVTEFDSPLGTLEAVNVRKTDTDTVWTRKYPVASLDDIEKIRAIPWEVPPEVRPPEASELALTREGRGVVRAGVSSPAVCVGGMMAFDYFLQLCATHFDLIRELALMCLRRILAVLDVVLAERTVEYVWLGGCEWLTPPMGSPGLYRELVQELERPIIERVHEAGALAHVHCHGRVRTTIELAIKRGADYFEPVEPPPDGDITFAEAKEIAAGRMTLGGNIEARILENGTPDDVDRAVRAAFEGGNHRMVLRTTAGPLGRMSPRAVANYHRMLDLWEELS
jgi:hypothetical protein